MAIFDRVARALFGRQPAVVSADRRPVAIRARYDAAQTTANNSRHWANTDSLDANAANSAGVRTTIRERARYEVANNSYARGITQTLAADLVGTGPRLRVALPTITDPLKRKTLKRQLKAAFAAWARSARLAERLQTMALAKVVDGESFALFTTNERLTHGVKLDLRLVECDQVTTPDLAVYEEGRIDGIHVDALGNPTAYDVLRAHPGADTAAAAADALKYTIEPRDKVSHLFRCDRPGQLRGISEITPALPLFAQLRRFTLATISAAEGAANFTGVMHTNAGAVEEPDDVEPLSALEVERNALLTLPQGWAIDQMKAQHPSTTYEVFVCAILREIARCLHMPSIIALGDASKYNFASGRLDIQTYHLALRLARQQIEIEILDRLFALWLEEALFIPGLLPAGLPPFDQLAFSWMWDRREPVNPQQEAQANKIKLETAQTTLDRIHADAGNDADEELDTWEEEQERIRAATPQPTPPADHDEDGEADDKPEPTNQKAAA